MEVVVIDFETTGLSCQQHRIIEVGAVIVDGDGHITQTFQELCNPGMKVSKFITSFTGISNEMLVGKPSPEEVMHKLHDFIGPRPLVAHNASFDSQFLRAEMKRIDKLVENPFLCSLLLARRLLPDQKSFKLSALKDYIKFKADASHCDHRALDDVLVTVELWNHLLGVIRKRVPPAEMAVGTLQRITRMAKKKVAEVYLAAPTDCTLDPSADKENVPPSNTVSRKNAKRTAADQKRRGRTRPTPKRSIREPNHIGAPAVPDPDDDDDDAQNFVAPLATSSGKQSAPRPKAAVARTRAKRVVRRDARVCNVDDFAGGGAIPSGVAANGGEALVPVQRSSTLPLSEALERSSTLPLPDMPGAQLTLERFFTF